MRFHCSRPPRFPFPLLGLCAALVLLLAGPAHSAENTIRLDEMVVNATRIITPTMQSGDTVFTGTQITTDGIEMQGGRTETSIYNALQVIPGVNVESADGFGLSPEQNTIRTRGVRGYLGSLSVEGVPNWGGNPIGPREYLYDTNNFESVTIYKGAVPADIGTGMGARGGAIELRPKWPKADPGVEFEQGLGSNAYSRSFLRLDSGEVTDSGTALSGSVSYTEADKWKGPGQVGPRTNVNLMLRQPTVDDDDIRVFFNSNYIESDMYRALSHAEARSLSDHYTKDFNSELTGNNAQDIYYYKYNRGTYNNNDVMSIITASVDDTLGFTFKPFYAKEDSTIYAGNSSNNRVQQRNRYIERFGAAAEMEKRFGELTTVLGYMYEAVDMRITTKNYIPSTGQFANYGIYTRNLDKGHMHSPFLKVGGEHDRFKWQAGLKYFYYRDPATQGYTSQTGAPSVLVHQADLDRATKEYDALLPTVALSYAVSDTVEPFASYGRSQIRPYSYVPIINTYSSNRAAFQAAGVTLDELFDGYDMETTDTVELGVRLSIGRAEITPSVYYTKSENLLVTVHDPRIGVSGVNYQQNVGAATGYGAEVEANVHLTENFTWFLSPSYSVLTYDDDLTFAGNTLDSKGRQVVDTPLWMAKTGFIFRHGGFEISPMLRLVGERYGDLEHKEKVGGYGVVDLCASYTFTDLDWAKRVRLSLDLYNLLDSEYISAINTGDDTRAGNSTYMVGAPFTALLRLAVEF